MKQWTPGRQRFRFYCILLGVYLKRHGRHGLLSTCHFLIKTLLPLVLRAGSCLCRSKPVKRGRFFQFTYTFKLILWSHSTLSGVQMC